MNRQYEMISRLVEEPQLVQVVQNLHADQLLKIIRHIGIEDAGSFIAIASSVQLEMIFDQVLWKNRVPGKCEQFDPEEFALWLKILYEHSGPSAVQTVMEIDEDLLTLGIVQNLLVVDQESLSMSMENTQRSVEYDLLDKMLDSERLLEWGDLLLLAKETTHWDTLIALLVDLDSKDHDLVQRLLERCNYISTEYIEDNGGLYNVLSAGEMLEVDAASDREERRSRQGYVAPETAVAFLRQAEITLLEELLSEKEDDYLTRSYFRSYEPHRQVEVKRSCSPTGKSSMHRLLAEAFPEIHRELKFGGALSREQSGRSTLLSSRFPVSGFPSSREVIPSALQHLESKSPELFHRYLSELHYLANILLAVGYSKNNGDQRMRPIEAAEKVMTTCHQGLTLLLPDKEPALEETVLLLERTSLVKLFRIGWHSEQRE